MSQITNKGSIIKIVYEVDSSNCNVFVFDEKILVTINEGLRFIRAIKTAFS